MLLIAEDTDSNYLLLSLMLRKEYEVIRAGDGEEVVRLCEQIQPDIVLMDIQMPEMDGLEATRQIRASGKHRDLPIIAMTAHAFEDEKLRCQQAGMNDFLSKPIDPNKLKDSIRRWVSAKAKPQQ